MNLSGYGCSKKLLWVISSLLLINLASISYAGSECDQLAALEADPLSVSAPVNFADLKAEKVIAACSEASEQAAITFSALRSAKFTGAETESGSASSAAN